MPVGDADIEGLAGLEFKPFTNGEAQDLKPRGIKAPLHLLPFRPLAAIAAALEYGARKYAPWNWTEQTADSREAYTAALLRHAHQFADPTEPDDDEESGLSHLAHVGACLLILLFHLKIGYRKPKDPPK